MERPRLPAGQAGFGLSAVPGTGRQNRPAGDVDMVSPVVPPRQVF
jgi:hypothetical protein